MVRLQLDVMILEVPFNLSNSVIVREATWKLVIWVQERRVCVCECAWVCMDGIHLRAANEIHLVELSQRWVASWISAGWVPCEGFITYWGEIILLLIMLKRFRVRICLLQISFFCIHFITSSSAYCSDDPFVLSPPSPVQGLFFLLKQTFLICAQCTFQGLWETLDQSNEAVRSTVVL